MNLILSYFLSLVYFADKKSLLYFKVQRLTSRWYDKMT